MSELGLLGGSPSSATGACAVSSSMVLPSQSSASGACAVSSSMVLPSQSSASGACAVSSSMVLPSQSPATAVSMPQAAAREALVGRERMLPISSPMACGSQP